MRRPSGPLDLTARTVEPELMDSPALDAAAHHTALDALARVNAVSLSARRVWLEIVRLAEEGVCPVRVLDVACGGGDILVSLARRAESAGIEVELHGCDVSAVALDRARGKGGDALGVAFHVRDVLVESVPTGFDVVCTSLFLHHLSVAEAVTLLGDLSRAAEHVVLVQDLRRTRLGLVFARVGLGILTRSPVVRHDGPASVAAAFTLSEVEALCDEAGLVGASVRPAWPQRLTIRWARA